MPHATLEMYLNATEHPVFLLAYLSTLAVENPLTQDTVSSPMLLTIW